MKVSLPAISADARGSLSYMTFSVRKSGQQMRYQRKQKDVLTPARLSQRSRYSAGVSAWRALSTMDRMPYEAKAEGLHMSGYNYFMKVYLNTHEGALYGSFQYGLASYGG